VLFTDPPLCGVGAQDCARLSPHCFLAWKSSLCMRTGTLCWHAGTAKHTDMVEGGCVAEQTVQLAATGKGKLMAWFTGPHKCMRLLPRSKTNDVRLWQQRTTPCRCIGAPIHRWKVSSRKSVVFIRRTITFQKFLLKSSIDCSECRGRRVRHVRRPKRVSATQMSKRR